jgi:hypothetical protein
MREFLACGQSFDSWRRLCMVINCVDRSSFIGSRNFESLLPPQAGLELSRPGKSVIDKCSHLELVCASSAIQEIVSDFRI